MATADVSPSAPNKTKISPACLIVEGGFEDQVSLFARQFSVCEKEEIDKLSRQEN
jgi:hypothetical protein